MKQHYTYPDYLFIGDWAVPLQIFSDSTVIYNEKKYKDMTEVRKVVRKEIEEHGRPLEKAASKI